MNELPHVTIERCGIDTNRIQPMSIDHERNPEQQQWFATSRNGCWRAIFGRYTRNEVWHFTVWELSEFDGNETLDQLCPPDWYATAEELFERVKAWLEVL
jgi:hypothetical protein